MKFSFCFLKISKQRKVQAGKVPTLQLEQKFFWNVFIVVEV